MVKNISVVMIVKNGAKTLDKSLSSLKRFSNVVVYSNGSTDRTKEICEQYANVRYIEGEFIGFGPTKNMAIGFAQNDWILSLDCDEVLSDAFVDELQGITLDIDTVYTIKRDNYYHGKHMRCCGWENDYVLRVFHRKEVLFHNQLVHESLNTSGKKIEKLHTPIKHFPYQNTEALIGKIQSYSSLYAQAHYENKKATAWSAFGRASFAFIKHFIFQKGFLYGYEGLLICVSNANHVFYKYMKLIEFQKEKEGVKS